MNRVRWTLAVLGAAAASYGVWCLVTALPTRALIGWAVLVGVGILLHDVAIAGLTWSVATVMARWLPRWAVGPVFFGVLVTGVLAAVAWPMLLRLGEDPVNPSFLPRDYTVGALRALALIWGGVVLGLIVNGYRARAARRRRSTPVDVG